MSNVQVVQTMKARGYKEMSIAKSTHTHLSALTERLHTITAQISKCNGNQLKRNRLIKQRVAIFQELHQEKARLRADALSPVQVLSTLTKKIRLSPKQSFALEVAVELFQVVPNEEIHYAVRQAKAHHQ